ncbi:hypothetical protein Tco_0215235 [Tanacetum coccineum]
MVRTLTKESFKTFPCLIEGFVWFLEKIGDFVSEVFGMSNVDSDFVENRSDFLLEEVDAFLALEDDPTSPEVDHSYYDSEGDILLLEAFLNDDPSLPPPTQGN